MREIKQNSVDIAFSEGAARRVTIIMRSEKEWYFTFEADDPAGEKPVTYAMLTQRGKLRTWADPRNLFEFLNERGVSSGSFNLKEENGNEIIGNQQGEAIQTT